MKKKQDLTLSDVRNKIDAIDSQFLKLLKDRLECARKIGELKAKNNKAKWDPVRERQIFERLLAENQGFFPEQPLLSIFHEIISTCRLSQKMVEVAYLGPESTFSHLAGVKQFGHAAVYRPMETIEDTFVEVERGRTEYGIVPVENSIEGAVTSTLDAFIKYKVRICSELNLGIVHNLVNQSGRLEDIKKVVSHAQPLAQCRQWLKKHLPGIPTQDVFSSGLAAKMAAEDPAIAAIASSLAIKTYRLQTVVKGIEDYRGNTTRFLLIGKESPAQKRKRQNLAPGRATGPARRPERCPCHSGPALHQPDQNRVSSGKRHAGPLSFLHRYAWPHRGRYDQGRL